jgi:outer membrane receptor for ferrienterochelin and colicin
VSYTQNISGLVVDKDSKEPIIGAIIYSKVKSTISDNNGTFSIGFNENTWYHCQYLGYNIDSIFIEKPNEKLIFRLEQSNILLNQVEIIDNKDRYLRERPQTGFNQITREEILKMPALLGEADVMKALQTIPGIKFGVEGSSSLFVRGGSAGQNLILIDDIPVFNSDHAFGFLSIVPAKSTKNVNAYKSGFSAEYGNRTSSVIDIQTNSGNKENRNTSISMSNIAASLYHEGPLIKDKLSYVLTGRYSFLQFFTDFGFYDGSLKLDYAINNKSRLSYFGLYTNDEYDDFFKDGNGRYNQRDRVLWKNNIHGISYSSLLSNSWSLNASLHYSGYNLNAISQRKALRRSISSYNSEFNSNISDTGGKFYFTKAINNTNLKLGGGLSRFIALPEKSSFVEFRTDTLGSFAVNLDQQKSTLGFIFMEANTKILENISGSFGLRYNLIATSKFNSQLEPRINLSYLINKNNIIKTSYTIVHQNNHYLSGSSVSLPTDSWINADENIMPARSTQVSLSYNRINLFKNLNYETEAYYKVSENDILRIPGFLPLSQSFIDRISPAKGLAYGIENQLKYFTKKININLGYTLSKATRKFYDEDLNNGNSFPFRFDKRHDLNLTINYNFKPKIKSPKKTILHSLSLDWTYNSGAFFTIDRLIIYNPALYDNLNSVSKGPVSSFPESINNYNAPDFHRLNMAWTIQIKKPTLSHKITTGLYNAYNQRNVFILQQELYPIFPTDNDTIGLKLSTNSNSLLPILPFISYEISF